MTTETSTAPAPVTDGATASQATTEGVGNLLADATSAPVSESAPEATEAPAPAETPAPTEAPKPTDAPAVEYTDFKLPEGVKVDETGLNDFKEFAKSNNWSQETAQKALDKYTNAMQQAATAQRQAWDEMQRGWQNEVKQEYPGEKLTDALKYADKALNQFGDAKLREALAVTGAGNHPAIVKAFAEIGKLVSEGKFVKGNNPSTPKSAAELLYPNLPKS